MSISLILWKAPIVFEAEEAEALLKPWYDSGDDSGFEASDDIKRCADELRRRFPDGPSREPPGESSPWAQLPFHQSERLLILTLRGDSGEAVFDAVFDAVVDLAEAHRLVLYDPQGPEIVVPYDLLEPEAGPAGFADYLRFGLFGLGSAGLLALGQWLTIPVLDATLTAFGGFLTAVFLFVLVRILLASRERTR